MFTLHLSTSKEGWAEHWKPSTKLLFSPSSFGSDFSLPDLHNPWLASLNFRDYLINFPEPGIPFKIELEIPLSEIALRIGISPKRKSDTDPSFPVWTSVSPLGPHDTLVLNNLEPGLITGNVLHREQFGRIMQERRAKNCVARCADGTSSQGCVICEFEDVTIKLCC